jgi:uncharacterized protein YebE (UPF0316 family)
MTLLASAAETPLWLPVLVFVAETCVVTLATLRIIFVSRGMKFLASGIGFFEITIWLFAIGQIMRNLDNVGCFLGFAAGFTLGNWLGVLIENKLALGTQVVRVITGHDATELMEDLKDAGFGVTRILAEGTTGPVQIVFSVIQRKELRQAVTLIRRFDEKAFYSVEDVQAAAAGVFPATQSGLQALLPSTLRLFGRAA